MRTLLTEKLKENGVKTNNLKFTAFYIKNMDINVEFDEFLLQMQIPAQSTILGVAKMNISPEGTKMGAFTLLSEEKNQPTPHKTRYCDINVGQVMKVIYTESASDMCDGWYDKEPVIQYYAVTGKNKSGSKLTTQMLFDFDETTGSCSGFEQVILTKKIKHNTLYWDIFYKEYYWQDSYCIDKVFNFPGV